MYFVITPNHGVENAFVSDQLSLAASVADDLHATLVEHDDGIWVFRWTPPKGLTSFSIYRNITSIPAWTAVGSAGTVVLSGPSVDWLAAGNGKQGYVVAGDYWRRGTGSYEAEVSLSANVSVNVEVWNETADTLLARRQLPSTIGLEDVSLDFDLTRVVPTKTVAGSGLFKILPIAPAPGDSIEIRVWSAGDGGVSVYKLGLRRV